MKAVLLLFLFAFASCANGFGVASLSSSRAAPLAGSASGGSSFVVSQGHQQPTQRRSSSSSALKSALYMGSMAKFGIFSPAVYVAKIALGQDKLNKIRGKAISLHSQSITDFAEWVGAYHLRTKLIKKAKQNGDTLGFLV
jgi:hypothetical protein